jgi:amino acid transporter
VLGVYLASAVGYARVAYAMGRDGTLPAFFGRLNARCQSPWNALHLVFAVTLAVAALWGRWVGLYLSYEWWGASLVFFAMISNAVVNLGCTVFFYRFRRSMFNWCWHGVVPAIGLLSSFLPLYYCFGPDLWHAGWAKGQSIIALSVAIVLATALYTIGLGIFKPEVLQRSAPTETVAPPAHDM